MTQPRGLIMPVGTNTAFRVTSYCTRRLPLFGMKWAHRKDWVGEVAGELLRHFRIELYVYAVLTNGLHLVLRPRADLVAELDAEQIARSGHATMPVRGGPRNSALPMDRSLLEQMSETAAWQKEYRQRLGSVSWFMRCLKQRIAQRANREDGSSGHFWDARFASSPLADASAVLAAMVQVDALPYLAHEMEAPGLAPHTSLRARLASELPEPEQALAGRLMALSKIASCGPQRPKESIRLTNAQYAHLVLAECGESPSLAERMCSEIHRHR